jgi:hypothetical protein
MDTKQVQALIEADGKGAPAGQLVTPSRQTAITLIRSILQAQENIRLQEHSICGWRKQLAELPSPDLTGEAVLGAKH